MKTLVPLTVTRPERAAPVLAPTVNVRAPFPLPCTPELKVIQGTLAVAVQEQVLAAWAGDAPPSMSLLRSIHGSLFYFPGAPVWLTVTFVPLMVIVPIRAAPVLSATAKVTVPLPTPVAPETKLIQDTFADALHVQELAALTGNWNCRPPEGTLLKAATVRVTEQVATPCWVTVKVWPPMVRVPVLEVLPVLAVTVYVTDPFPEPLLPELMAIQETVLLAVQLQPAPAVTLTVPVPPTEAKPLLVGEIEYVQLLPAAWVTVKVWPAIVMVPVLEVLLLLAPTE